MKLKILEELKRNLNNLSSFLAKLQFSTFYNQLLNTTTEIFEYKHKITAINVEEMHII